jgi:peptidoglycan/LPS O-acetylase OafA/YrhL
MTETSRLDQIDGLRTVAIFWVAMYHFAVFWSPAGAGLNLLPYGTALAQIPLASVGFLGVHLFFIVSGFVIALSLQRSAGVAQFLQLRAIRLWPTLIICGTITLIVVNTVGPVSLMRGPLEYLVSLTFFPPSYVGRVIGSNELEWLDGAYWSLWTEIRFYVVAGFLFFISRQRFVLSWSLFAAVSAIIHLTGVVQGGAIEEVSRLMFAEYQPYFSVGIAIAAIRGRSIQFLPMALLCVGIILSFAYPWIAQSGFAPSEFIGLVIVFALALPVMLTQRRVPVLSSPVMVSLGAASYAYYLLHQNVGLSILGYIAPNSDLLAIGAMILVQAGLLVLAVFITRKIEEPIRRSLRKRIL